MAIFSLSSLCITNLAGADDHSVSPFWASYYEIDLSTFDLDADADGDGLTGRDEAAFGTDPLNGDSVVRPTLRKSGVETLLEWETVPGALYQIEVGTDLAGWDAFGNPGPGTGARKSVAIEVQGPKRFFRVRALTPLDGDGDGLNSLDENFLGTDPDEPDSDGDTFYDGEEAFADANPGDPTKTPAGDIPPEPASIAPPADPSATTNAFLASQFLYTGDNPIQTGVAESAIEGKRAAIMRGKVTDRNGRPLPGVRITILNCPEFGQTLSRADGMFDLVVNGGGRITVRYERNGFLPVQRSLPTGWLNFTHVPDVALLRLDTAVTPVDLTAAVGPQLALGSEVTDDEGTRRGVLLVNEGTQAEIILPDASTRSVDSLNVRITEYTVGESGPNAMPGRLPPASAYTHAFEMSADESVAKIAGKDVLLSQPVYYYVDNFLDFPAGIDAPVGYYDNDSANWVASENGRVIAVVGETGGMVELDVDGDGSADIGARLSDLGIEDEERIKLAGLYDAGDSFWRVPLNHFSTYDVNWGRAPDADQTPPGQETGGGENRDPNSCQEPSSSFIIPQDQLLGESLPVVGTEFELVYISSRTEGWRPKYQLNIPLTRDELPDDLVRVDLELFIAGFELGRSFAPAPDLSYTFEWDRFDIYGNFLNGATPVTVRIGYVYNSPYAIVGRFGFFPDSTISVLGVPAREELILQQNYTTMVGGWDESGKGLGGWTFDVHHAYDPLRRVLHLGSGGIQVANDLAGAVINTAAGGGFEYPPEVGSMATEIIFSRPVGVAVDASGGVYVADEGQHRVFYFSEANILTRIIGTGIQGFSGDGGPASAAQLSVPRALAVGADGSLYIAEQGRIRHVNPQGVISTLAGTGVLESDGDGGPAIKAKIWPVDLAEGPDGNLYIADLAGYKIRRVDSEGVIITVAGTGVFGFSGDGGPAAEAQMMSPLGVDVAADGNIYVADNARIRRISTDGVIRTIAGNGTQGSTGDGFSALGASINPTGIAVAPDGGVYISEPCRIRRVRADGVISAVAGSEQCGLAGDGGPAVAGSLHNIFSVAVGPDASVYAAETTNHRIRRIEPAFPGFAPGDNPLLAAKDGSVVYRFTDAGRHLQTINALTGGVLYEFSYDSVGRLSDITDGDGNVTVVERDTDGNVTAIVAPYGQRTELGLDDNGYLSSITDPANESESFVYTDDGLMTSGTDANDHTSNYEYCALGRLTRVEDADGGFQTLARDRLDNGHEVTKTDALDRVTKYRLEKLNEGGRRLLNTYPDGTQSVMIVNSNGEIVTTYPDGTVITQKQGPDPRFGMQAPVAESIEIAMSEAGIVQTFNEKRQVTLGDTGNVLNLKSHLTSYTINDNRSTVFYDGSSRQLTTTTPEGRTTVVTLDEQGRQTDVNRFGLSESYIYNDIGQLETIELGDATATRTTEFSYGQNGFVDTIKDSMDQVRKLVSDVIGRTVSLTDPDENVIELSYDAKGNLLDITPPNRPSHSFNYTDVDLRAHYIPPDLGVGDVTTNYTFNKGRQITSIDRPDGNSLVIKYNPGSGTLKSLSTPRGENSYNYDPTTGQLIGIDTSDDIRLKYEWQNSLLTKVSWAGPVNAFIGLSYNIDLRLQTVSVNGLSPIGREYDKDGLLKSVGDLTYSHNPLSRRVSQTRIGEVVTVQAYNDFGELLSLSAKYGDEVLLDFQYTQRDTLGRIRQKVETIANRTIALDYSYDPVGRLISVSENGNERSHYTYDKNSNCLSKSTSLESVSATYDDQDRMTSYDQASYTFSAYGDLLQVSNGSDTTTYDYDVFGNLRAVELPDGRHIEYLIDGRNRRIGKKVDGVHVQQLLYLDKLSPIAELDGDGNLVARFIHGSHINVPDYMIKGGKTYRLICDHLGSVRLVVDTATGTVAQQLDYDEFGHILVDTSPGFQPFGFSGGLYDPDTGHLRFGARDYDPASGRWMLKDPILFDGGQANLYVYAANDPINSHDPTGFGLPVLIGVAVGGSCGVYLLGEQIGFSFEVSPYTQRRQDLDALINRAKQARDSCRNVYRKGQYNELIDQLMLSRSAVDQKIARITAARMGPTVLSLGCEIVAIAIATLL